MEKHNFYFASTMVDIIVASFIDNIDKLKFTFALCGKNLILAPTLFYLLLIETETMEILFSLYFPYNYRYYR